jgi:hypothetical protein
MDKKRSPGAGYFTLVIFLGIFFLLFHQASPTFSATPNRITSISPICEWMNSEVLIHCYALGNEASPNLFMIQSTGGKVS